MYFEDSIQHIPISQSFLICRLRFGQENQYLKNKIEQQIPGFLVVISHKKNCKEFWIKHMFQEVPTSSKSNEFSIPSDFEEAEILSLIISVRVKETPENLEKTQCQPCLIVLKKNTMIFKTTDLPSIIWNVVGFNEII